MDVATLCNKYQKKMWISMIVRKQLNINIWDVIEYAHEKVYYIPHTGHCKFEVKSRNCRLCSKGLEVGFKKTDFRVKPCTCAADGKKTITVEKLLTLFNNTEAKDIVHFFNNHKTRKLSNRITHWVDQGYSYDEAVSKVTEIQTTRSSKSPASQKGTKGYSVRTKEFWIKKGFTEEEAVSKVSEIQVANGLSWYKARYGESEGKIRYEARIKQWINSYNRALELDPTIKERKMVTICKASKESLNVFLPVYCKYKDVISIYLGIDNNNEYFLRDGKTIYFYDFTIHELKLIVEFNGSKFHPSPTLTESEWSNWKSLFSNKSADVVVANDNAKKKIAEHYGYTVLTIWDTDDVKESICKLEKIIEERLNAI